MMLEIRHPFKSVRETYNEVYRSRGIRQMDSFFLWILGLLNPIRGQSLLDLSCGEGQLLHIATARGVHAHGIDISDAAARIAQQATPAARLVIGNGEALPYPDNTFDAVTNLGSLEHYEHPDRGAREMARVLTPGGTACILVPNSFGLRWNVWHVWRTGDIFDDGFQPIQRYATRGQWTRLLEENGLIVRRTLGYEHERAWPRTWEDGWGYLKNPRRLLSAFVLVPLIPVSMASMFVFLCEKASKTHSAHDHPKVVSGNPPL